MPRHPPNAHNNEHTQTIKQTQSRHMRHTTARHHPHTPTQPRKEKTGKEGGGRENRRRTANHKTSTSKTPRTRQPGPEEASHIIDARVHYAVHNQPAHTPPHNSLRRGCSAQGAPPQNPTACHAPHPWNHIRNPLRKEVIQPHLPVRLPCYDFVPITGPAFDRSP